MKAKVNEDCISCGVCVDMCPDVFEMEGGGMAHPKVDVVPPDVETSAREACEACPVDAIVLEE
jgi:ferredoxin